MKLANVCLRDSYRRFTRCGKPPKKQTDLWGEFFVLFFTAEVPLDNVKGFLVNLLVVMVLKKLDLVQT